MLINTAMMSNSWRNSNICLRKTTKMQCVSTNILHSEMETDKLTWRMSGLTHSVFRGQSLTPQSMMHLVRNTMWELPLQDKLVSWAWRVMASNKPAKICRWLLGYSRISRTTCHSLSQERQALILRVSLWLVSVLSCLLRPNTCFTRWLQIRKWRPNFYPKLLFRSLATFLRHMKQVRLISQSKSTKMESGLMSFVTIRSTLKPLLGRCSEYTGSKKLRIKEKIWVSLQVLPPRAENYLSNAKKQSILLAQLMLRIIKTNSSKQHLSKRWPQRKPNQYSLNQWLLQKRLKCPIKRTLWNSKRKNWRRN